MASSRSSRKNQTLENRILESASGSFFCHHPRRQFGQTGGQTIGAVMSFEIWFSETKEQTRSKKSFYFLFAAGIITGILYIFIYLLFDESLLRTCCVLSIGPDTSSPFLLSSRRSKNQTSSLE